MGIPFELITMMGGGIFGAVVKLSSIVMANKREAHQQMMDKIGVRRKAVNDARKFLDKRFQITRQIVVLSSVFAIIVWPKIVPVFFPDISVTLGWLAYEPGFKFLWLFGTEGKQVLEWTTASGLVLTPLDTNLMAGIVGMYLGSSLADDHR